MSRKEALIACFWGLSIGLIFIGGYIMGHGTPDWWGSEPGETTYQVQDVGELAARLGSIDTFDRRGNVVFIDSFENGLAPYDTDAGQAGSAVVLSAITSRNGSYSCKLTTGAVANAYAYVVRQEPYPVPGKCGFEIAFTMNTGAVDMQIDISIYDGVNRTRFTVKYLPDTDKWQYRNSAGAWVDLATGVGLAAYDKHFNVAKLVVDTVSLEYYYFLWNENEVSMAGIAGYQVASTLALQFVAIVILDGGAAAAATIYVDDVIITQNEP